VISWTTRAEYRLAMTSYASDIKPLFRERDRGSMLGHFDLWSYDDVVENKDAILESLAEGDMPCDGPWPAEQVELFRSWVAPEPQPRRRLGSLGAHVSRSRRQALHVHSYRRILSAGRNRMVGFDVIRDAEMTEIRRTTTNQAVSTHLNSDHRSTLEKIFAHPSSANLEWRQVKSLLEALGAATEEHNGKLRVTLGGETEVLQPPHGKDIDRQMIVDLRRMLTGAGITAPD
jgi:hypothetical protein